MKTGKSTNFLFVQGGNCDLLILALQAIFLVKQKKENINKRNLLNFTILTKYE